MVSEAIRLCYTLACNLPIMYGTLAMRLRYTFENIEKEFHFDSPIVLLGRQLPGENVVNLYPDKRASYRHARLSMEDSEYWVEDLNSTRGTLVNGVAIEAKTRLRPGDKIQLGHTFIEVILENVPVEPVVAKPETHAARRTITAAAVEDRALEKGQITHSIFLTELPTNLLFLPTEARHLEIDIARRQLLAFYELEAELAVATGIEKIFEIVVEHVLIAIPEGESAGLLFQEGEIYELRTHQPKDKPAYVSSSLVEWTMFKQQAFIWRTGDSTPISPEDSMIARGIQCAMYAPIIWNVEQFGVLYVDNHNNPNAFTEHDLRLMSAIANQAALFLKNHLLQQALRREEMRRANLLRHFSPHVAERLIQKPESLRLGGERISPVTILVLDIRGFTALSAQMSPEQVVRMLNRMFSLLTPIIFKYGGSIDKYTGDGILAVFGSPEPDLYQCENAVRAALTMQEAMLRENIGCEIGIGIHQGAVVHGFIGSTDRMEYTVVGDTVNRATRYCGSAGRGEIVISEAVYSRVETLVQVKFPARKVTPKHPDEPAMDGYLVESLIETLSS